MKLHIIWDKEQIRYSSYLPKYATHTFLNADIMRNFCLHKNSKSGELQ